MLTISKQNCTLSKDNELGAFASDIGLRPGEWPELIAVVENPEASETVGILFIKARPIVYGQEREFGGYEYETKSGAARLAVFND